MCISLSSHSASYVAVWENVTCNKTQAHALFSSRSICQGKTTFGINYLLWGSLLDIGFLFLSLAQSVLSGSLFYILLVD